MKISTHPSKHSTYSNYILLLFSVEKKLTRNSTSLTQQFLHRSHMKDKSPRISNRVVIRILSSDQLYFPSLPIIFPKRETVYQRSLISQTNLKGRSNSFCNILLGFPPRGKVISPSHLIQFKTYQISIEPPRARTFSWPRIRAIQNSNFYLEILFHCFYLLISPKEKLRASSQFKTDTSLSQINSHSSLSFVFVIVFVFRLAAHP